MIHFFVFQKHSVFVPLRTFYPEAIQLTEQVGDPHPTACFTHPTPTNARLIEPLVRRSNYVFSELLPKLQAKQPLYILYLYYKWANKPNSIQAAAIRSDYSDPKVLVLNPYAFKKFQREGKLYEWDPPLDFQLMGHSNEVLL